MPEKSITKVLLGDALMFPSEYVTALEFRGKDVTLTIDGISQQELPLAGGKSKPGIVVTFKGTKKKFVCNRTNAGAIADVLGDKQARNWPGKRITLYPTRCKFGREMVDCIRVRDTRPPKETPAPDLDDREPIPGEVFDPDVFADPAHADAELGPGEPAPRGPGRPKGSTNKPAAAATEAVAAEESAPSPVGQDVATGTVPADSAGEPRRDADWFREPMGNALQGGHAEVSEYLESLMSLAAYSPSEADKTLKGLAVAKGCVGRLDKLGLDALCDLAVAIQDGNWPGK